VKDIKKYLGKKEKIIFDPKFDIYEDYKFSGHLKQDTLHKAKVLVVYIVTIQNAKRTLLTTKTTAK
jgi:hypothetical protein